MTMNNSQTQTNAKAAPWTAQCENFHWILKSLRSANFLGGPYMVEASASRITLGLRPGHLVIQVGGDGKTAFIYRNGIVHFGIPYYVPSRDIGSHIGSFLAELRRRGWL